MNILIIAPWFPSKYSTKSFGGIFLLRTLKNLIERGHKFWVVVPQRRDFPKFEFFDGIKVYRIGSILLPGVRYPIPNLIEYIQKIKNILDHENIDLIDISNQEYLTSLLIFYLKRKYNSLPVTLIVNGLPGISWFYGVGIVDFFGRLHTNLLGKRIIMKADGIRVLNSTLVDDIKKFYPKKENIWKISYGVDFKEITFKKNRKKMREKIGINKDEIAILYVGRIEPVKGADVLLEAAEKLSRKYSNVKFVFIGKSDPFKFYKTTTLRLKEKLLYLGTVENVFEYMRACDIFILPSLSEGSPNVLMEAGACGLPSVASDVPGNIDIIIDGETGFLFKSRDVNQLISKISILIENSDLRERMGEKAEERIKSNFNMDQKIIMIEDFYFHIKKFYQKKVLSGEKNE